MRDSKQVAANIPPKLLSLVSCSSFSLHDVAAGNAKRHEVGEKPLCEMEIFCNNKRHTAMSSRLCVLCAGRRR